MIVNSVNVRVRDDAARIYLEKWKGRKEFFKGERVRKGVHANALRIMAGGVYEARALDDGTYDILTEKIGRFTGWINVNPECIVVIP